MALWNTIELIVKIKMKRYNKTHISGIIFEWIQLCRFSFNIFSMAIGSYCNQLFRVSCTNLHMHTKKYYCNLKMLYFKQNASCWIDLCIKFIAQKQHKIYVIHKKISNLKNTFQSLSFLIDRCNSFNNL